MCKSYGYVRVSSTDQNVARQMDAMTAIGLQKKDVYVDKLSGKDFNRPSWKRLIRKAEAGDVIYLKSLDRLGRDYDDIGKEWDRLKEKGVAVVILDMPLLDTRSDQNANGLTGQFIADLVLIILSYVAQTERENIHQRQMEGIEAAKRRGVRFGRPEIQLPDNFEEVAKNYRRGEYTLRKAAEQVGMKTTTFYEKLRKFEAGRENDEVAENNSGI